MKYVLKQDLKEDEVGSELNGIKTLPFNRLKKGLHTVLGRF
jgi:hypothetical protein